MRRVLTLAFFPIAIAYSMCAHCQRPSRSRRPVLDKTGLSGYYDLALNAADSDTQSDSAALGPSIFTALEEQLGL